MLENQNKGNFMEKEKRYVLLDFFKAFAALIIINSHFDTLYPIKALATGGAIGNALFFGISGFLLFPIKKDFKEWIFPKLLSLYIPMFPLAIIMILTIKKESLNKLGVIGCLIWPTVYWFIGAIIFFYLLYYLLRNIKNDNQFYIFFAVLIIIYSIYYTFILDTSNWVIETSGLENKEGFFKLIYYFAIMMIGKWFRINENKSFIRKKFYICGVIISFISIYFVKWLMDKKSFFYHFQFLNQVSIVFLVIFIFMLFLSLKDTTFIQNKKLINISNFLGKHTLEMYLTQFIIISYCEKIIFPINIIFAFILIIFTSYILKKYSTYVIKNILKR